MKNLAILFFLLTAVSAMVDAQTCEPSGHLRGGKPPKHCNTENESECCKEGEEYAIYRCSPTVTSRTKAVLTINSFEKDGDGGWASACDGEYHDDNTPVVALSTGWFDNKRRCGNQIAIHANGRTVTATVVDECDSTMGCDPEHAYQPPCKNNIVDASRAVWESLGIREDQDEWGWLDIHWTDA